MGRRMADSVLLPWEGKVEVTGRTRSDQRNIGEGAVAEKVRPSEMAARGRSSLFISHASEDNDFTMWLGSRLSGAGYDVWADVLRLKGGDDWSRVLEDALRNKAAKMLWVATRAGCVKQGVRNEIQIATDVMRKLGDDNFIIPLKLDDCEAPFQAVHIQWIDFRGGWGSGFAELLENLAAVGIRFADAVGDVLVAAPQGKVSPKLPFKFYI